MPSPRTATIGVLLVALSAATAATALAEPVTPQTVNSAAQATVVNTVPASYTPDVTDGTVYAIGQTGTTVVLGGSFTSVAPAGSNATVSADGLTAFNAGTGALISGFQPTINGTVKAVLPGPTVGTVYVGGEFTTIDGHATKLALLDTATGAIVPGWTTVTFDGDVSSLALSGGNLFVGGYFSKVAGQSHKGLAVVNATTGAVSSYAVPAFSGHHNYNVNCNPSTQTCATGPVGIKAISLSPDASKLVAIGNFTTVASSARDQIAMLDLGDDAATVEASWATDAYTAGCDSGLFDSYVRDVQFSPDGSYFVVAATGAGGQVENSDGTPSNCDAAARFESDGTGSDVHPTWVDHTGNDTLLSVALTGTVAYLGGHERWVNNSTGVDSPGEGAVPRPGIVALDPVNGMPLKWNPGRNPRGSGAWSLLATSSGLYVGSDTDYIGDHLYLHRKIAFFPLAGGQTLATNSAYDLPGNVVLLGDTTDVADARLVTWDGSTAPTTPVVVGSTDWTDARGGFEINNTVYYGTTDGHFYRRSFDGSTFGPAITIDPYDDPVWAGVQTGSGQTYRGTKSNFYSETASLTSMFYSDGRLFYTLSGHSHLYWRWFEPDSGTVGADEFTAADAIDWSDVAGAFLSGSNLYFADATSGDLHSVAFTGDDTAGVPTVVDSSIDWKSSGAFVAAANQSTTNEPPTAEFVSACKALVCGFSAHGSADPDGSIADESWDWGDGDASSHAADPTFHTYRHSGMYVVTLTVTDNQDAEASISHRVTVHATPHPSFRAATSSHAHARSIAVSVPAAARKGDVLLLFVSTASRDLHAARPTGWSRVGSISRHLLTTTVFEHDARAADAGKQLRLRLPTKLQATATIAAYSGAASEVERRRLDADSGGETHNSPALAHLSDGSLVVTFWAARANHATKWHTPRTVDGRSATTGHGHWAVGSVLADSGTGVSGSYGGVVATSRPASDAGAGVSIALAAS